MERNPPQRVRRLALSLSRDHKKLGWVGGWLGVVSGAAFAYASVGVGNGNENENGENGGIGVVLGCMR